MTTHNFLRQYDLYTRQACEKMLLDARGGTRLLYKGGKPFEHRLGHKHAGATHDGEAHRTRVLLRPDNPRHVQHVMRHQAADRAVRYDYDVRPVPVYGREDRRYQHEVRGRARRDEELDRRRNRQPPPPPPRRRHAETPAEGGAERGAPARRLFSGIY